MFISEETVQEATKFPHIFFLEKRKIVMSKKIIFVLVIAALFAAGIVSPAVSAAGTADGKEIQNGDYVIIGETGLNFSKFAEGGYTWMVARAETGNVDFNIASYSNVDIPNNIETGLTYRQATSPDYTTAGSLGCIVQNYDYFPFNLNYEGAALVGKEVTIILKGKPGSTYKVYVDGGNSLGKTTITRESSKKQEASFSFTPDKAGTYTIIAECTASTIPDEEGKETTLQIRVDAKTMNVKMSIEIPADAKAGIFATGDIITLKGSIENFKYADPAITNVYLYITGRNLDANGVNLETKQPVVDGQTGTFTSVDEFDSEKGTWEYKWETANGHFEPGTYTIYAVAELSGRPIVGHLTTALDYGLTPGSTELYLSDKSIHVKFAEENGGTFTQGDVMYSYWSARGSPDKVRWYIIGQNFLETGLAEDFSIYTADQEEGKDAPQGVWGFVYDRYVSRDMAAGNYYLVFQHPGYNNEFDVNPDRENGYFSALGTTFGESSSLAGRPSSNCAEVLKELIDDILCDDLCIIADLTIESPWISIDHVENLEIGDKLKIKGKTNYAGEGTPVDGRNVENTLSLRIDRLNFDITEENAAMQLQIVDRVVPENIIPYYGERTYEFDEIDTSTWFAGTYQATVTNIDTGFEESIMFTVGGEGTVVDSSTLNVPSNPLEEPYEELEPLPPIERYEEPTEPEEPKSPGFILAPLALGLAVILRRK